MLITKFHCDDQCELPKTQQVGDEPVKNSLDQLFKPGFALWMDDIGFMKVALGPWNNEPVVVEYLNRIEQDRLRFREAFGL
jgi:hypothetical protein